MSALSVRSSARGRFGRGLRRRRDGGLHCRRDGGFDRRRRRRRGRDRDALCARRDLHLDVGRGLRRRRSPPPARATPTRSRRRRSPRGRCSRDAGSTSSGSYPTENGTVGPLGISTWSQTLTSVPVLFLDQDGDGDGGGRQVSGDGLDDVAFDSGGERGSRRYGQFDVRLRAAGDDRHGRLAVPNRSRHRRSRRTAHRSGSESMAASSYRTSKATGVDVMSVDPLPGRRSRLPPRSAVWSTSVTIATAVSDGVNDSSVTITPFTTVVAAWTERPRAETQAVKTAAKMAVRVRRVIGSYLLLQAR